MIRKIRRLARMVRWGRPGDRTGLTVACTGCPDTSPHDAHLAPGAAAFLASAKPRGAQA